MDRTATIKQAIDRLFGDTSVDAGTTRADLKDIREHINMLLETLMEMDGEE